jgi:hypothetical protein
LSNDESRPDAEIPPPGQRRAPTIDVTATEVSAEHPAQEASSSEAAETHPEQSAADTKPRRGSILPLMGAGLLGGVIAAAAAIVFASVSLAPSENGTALAARMSQIEQQMRELATRPDAAGVEAKRLDELASRIAKLESAVEAGQGARDTRLVNRISMLEGNLKALSESIGIAQRRSDEAEAAAREASQRAGALAGAMDTLAQRVGKLEQQLAKRSAEQTIDRPARLLIAATALSGALERGEPFAAQLAAVRALGADAPRLAALEPFATSGVPGAAALARELSALTPALLAAAGTPAQEGNFLQKLQASAERIVRVQRLDERPGNDAAAIVARIDADAGRGDLPSALAELAKLPADVRAPAELWIKKAQARAAALAAGRALTADALADVSK